MFIFILVLISGYFVVVFFNIFVWFINILLFILIMYILYEGDFFVFIINRGVLFWNNFRLRFILFIMYLFNWKMFLYKGFFKLKILFNCVNVYFFVKLLFVLLYVFVLFILVLFEKKSWNCNCDFELLVLLDKMIFK